MTIYVSCKLCNGDLEYRLDKVKYANDFKIVVVPCKGCIKKVFSKAFKDLDKQMEMEKVKGEKDGQ